MFADINWGRWTLNLTPTPILALLIVTSVIPVWGACTALIIWICAVYYVSDVIHDLLILRKIGRKIHRFPRLFDHGIATVKLKRRYPPRLIWMTRTEHGPAHMHYRLWSQHVK